LETLIVTYCKFSDIISICTFCFKYLYKTRDVTEYEAVLHSSFMGRQIQRCIASLNVDVNMSICLQYGRLVGHRSATVAILSDSTREQPRSVPVPKKKTDITGLEFRGTELNLEKTELNLEELS
jgi:hypothetical protein